MLIQVFYCLLSMKTTFIPTKQPPQTFLIMGRLRGGRCLIMFFIRLLMIRPSHPPFHPLQ